MCQIVITKEEASRTPYRVGITETGLMFVSSAAFISSEAVAEALKNPILLREGELNYKRDFEACEDLYPNTRGLEEDYYVLTSSRFSRGTTYLIDNAVLAHCHELMGQDYYLVPEGVDSLLLCPITEDAEELKSALKAANAACPEYVISDTVFLFNGQLTAV